MAGSYGAEMESRSHFEAASLVVQDEHLFVPLDGHCTHLQRAFAGKFHGKVSPLFHAVLRFEFDCRRSYLHIAVAFKSYSKRNFPSS